MFYGYKRMKKVVIFLCFVFFVLLISLLVYIQVSPDFSTEQKDTSIKIFFVLLWLIGSCIYTLENNTPKEDDEEKIENNTPKEDDEDEIISVTEIKGVRKIIKNGKVIYCFKELKEEENN